MDQEEFETDVPLILPWDRKPLLSTTCGKGKVDKIATLMSGGGIEKILGVSKVVTGSGAERSQVCMEALDIWNLKD